MSKDRIIRKVSSKEIFSCKWYKLKHDKIVLPNGKKGDYFFVDKVGSVMIIAIEDNKIILTKQYRYISKKNSLELPAGGFDNGNPKKHAQREFEEETGYKAKNWKKIGAFFPYNGISSEVSHVFLAKNLIKTKACPDETEFIDIIKKPIKEVYKMAEQNKITDGMTLVALLLAKKYLKI
ncbi:MAG: NUDIX hydrolase [Patescibacteria group bacterium]|nr:NUDIX hydrolase [Patescibacteria group bacterium]